MNLKAIFTITLLASCTICYSMESDADYIHKKLFQAVKDGTLETLKEYEQHIKNNYRDIKNELGSTLLHEAILIGNSNVIRWFFDNLSLSPSDFIQDDKLHHTPLSIAIETGAEDIVRKMLDALSGEEFARHETALRTHQKNLRSSLRRALNTFTRAMYPSLFATKTLNIITMLLRYAHPTESDITLILDQALANTNPERQPILSQLLTLLVNATDTSLYRKMTPHCMQIVQLNGDRLDLLECFSQPLSSFDGQEMQVLISMAAQCDNKNCTAFLLYVIHEKTNNQPPLIPGQLHTVLNQPARLIFDVATPHLALNSAPPSGYRGNRIDTIGLTPEVYSNDITFSRTFRHCLHTLGNFVGRKELLTSLAQKLIPSETTSTVVLCGSSGMGKTEIAKYFAFKERAYKLVFWMQADTENSLKASYLDLARLLNLSLKDTSTLNAVRTQIHSALEQRKDSWLLIFDNAQENIVLPTKGGSVIITSPRADLWESHDVIELSPLTHEEAITFLKNQTRQEDSVAMQTLAARCQGIPLALSTIVVLMRKSGSTIAELLNQLDEKYTAFQEPLDSVWNLLFDQIKVKDPKSFDILLSCAFLHPENISNTMIGDLLQQQYLIPQSEAGALADQFIADMESCNLIHFDRPHEACSFYPLVHKALGRYALDHNEHRNAILSLLERLGDKFDGQKIENIQDAKQWSVHAEFFLEQQETNLKNNCSYAGISDILGQIHARLGNFGKALKYHRQALESFKGIYGQTAHLDMVFTLNNLGLDLSQLNQYDEALEYYQQALEMGSKLDKKALPPGMAATLCTSAATIFSNKGSALYLKGRYHAAFQYQRKALEMRRKLYQADHPDIANSLIDVAITLDSLLNEDDALHHLQEAVAMQRNLYGPVDSHVATSLNNIGLVLLNQGKYDDALRYHQQALAMYKKMYGQAAHADVDYSLARIVKVLKKLGRHREALEYHIQALVMERQLWQETHLM